MGIEGEATAGEMAAGPPQPSPGGLHPLGLRHRVGVPPIMQGLIGGEKRQAVGQGQPGMGQAAGFPEPADAQGGLVHQLQQETGRDGVRRLPRPAGQQIPGAQAQVLGNQKPQTHARVGDPVGQELPHLPLQGERVGRGRAPIAAGAADFNAGRLRTKPVEFFFAGRTR